MNSEFQPAIRPTMHFIGVTTRQSSINALFPQWAKRLGLGDCELRGMDFPLHADPQHYRAAVDFIKHDPLSLGALVTSHKVDLFAACAAQFDVIEPLSRSLGEISSIFKRDGRLHGRAVDPWTSGYALAAFLPPDHWRSGGEGLIFGAGGSGTALAWQLSNSGHGGNRPRCIHVIDRIAGRIEHLRNLHATWGNASPLKAYIATGDDTARERMRQLPPGSLIVNATGLGKDTPGSPLPDDVIFPEHSWIWEFNYRGDLVFLEQARRHENARHLRIEDGWVYFVHGWTQVIADVFDRDIPTTGPLFDELSAIAAGARR